MSKNNYKTFFIIIFLLCSINIYAKNIIIFKQDNLYGYQQDGKVVIPAIYDEARLFNGDYAIVKKDGLYGVIDKNGSTEIEYRNHDIN